MPDYILRCGKLGALLKDYESNLQEGDRILDQVLEELQQLKADRGYAEMIPTFTALQNVIRKDLQSAQAFRKEVDYAKQLAALAGTDQARFYTTYILPVIADEKRIANEEVEILKDAKAHGVHLPETLYREAGIQ